MKLREEEIIGEVKEFASEKEKQAYKQKLLDEALAYGGETKL